jgi:hypothetical protein
MLGRVALVKTDVSEELSASFIRVRRISELGTTLAVTSNRRTLLGRHFEEDVLGLLSHVSTNSYFTFNGQFYGQTDGVSMGSPLSPVIAIFYMEDYEKVALDSPSPLKPCCRS